LRKVCTEPTCPVHHAKKQTPKADASFKAEQEKRRRDEALANATGIRVLQSIVAAVPVRLMKRDLLFVAEQLLPLLDEKGLEMVARNRSIKAKEGESVAKLLGAFVRKADEGIIGRLVVEAVILLSTRTQADGGKTLRAAAQVYGIDTDGVAVKVKQEFTAKDKSRKAAKPEPKPPAKPEAKVVKPKFRKVGKSIRLIPRGIAQDSLCGYWEHADQFVGNRLNPRAPKGWKSALASRPVSFDNISTLGHCWKRGNAAQTQNLGPNHPNSSDRQHTTSSRRHWVASIRGKCSKSFDPSAKVRTFREHSVDSDPLCRKCSFNHLVVLAVNANDPFGWGRIRIVVDVFRRREAIANLSQLCGQMRLSKRDREGSRVTEEEAFVFMHLQVWN
jgi:hypothetical protein